MSFRVTTTGRPPTGRAGSIVASLSVWALLSASAGLPACGAPENNEPSPQGVATPTVAPAPNRRALLIGINEYKARSVSSLHGCLHDIEAMRLLLERRYGFPSEQITALTDAQAT